MKRFILTTVAASALATSVYANPTMHINGMSVGQLQQDVARGPLATTTDTAGNTVHYQIFDGDNALTTGELRRNNGQFTTEIPASTVNAYFSVAGVDNVYYYISRVDVEEVMAQPGHNEARTYAALDADGNEVAFRCSQGLPASGGYSWPIYFVDGQSQGALVTPGSYGNPTAFLCGRGAVENQLSQTTITTAGTGTQTAWTGGTYTLVPAGPTQAEIDQADRDAERHNVDTTATITLTATSGETTLTEEFIQMFREVVDGDTPADVVTPNAQQNVQAQVDAQAALQMRANDAEILRVAQHLRDQQARTDREAQEEADRVEAGWDNATLQDAPVVVPDEDTRIENERTTGGIDAVDTEAKVKYISVPAQVRSYDLVTFVPAYSVGQIEVNAHNGETRPADDRMVNEVIVSRERMSEVLAKAYTYLNPAWTAAANALEKDLENKIKHGQKLIGDFENFILVINTTTAGIEVKKEFVVAKSGVDALTITPRLGVGGFGKSYKYTSYGAELAYENEEIRDLLIKVGYDTGTKFNFTQGVRNGFRGLSGHGSTADYGFVEIHQGAEDEIKVTVRHDTQGDYKVGLRKGPYSVDVNQDGQVSAKYTVKF